MKSNAAAIGFAALSQVTRVNLLRLLVGAGRVGLAAGEISRTLKIAPSLLSFHLSALENANLVKAARQGRRVIYSAQPSGLLGLFEFLSEACGASDPDFERCRAVPNRPAETARLGPAYNVLFTCTRNSARSIMAEVILNAIGGGRFKAYSAGSDPAMAPMTDVLDRLSSQGHDVSKLRSKSWDEFTGDSAPRMDFVITLCDPLDSEDCPDLGAQPITALWPFPDPMKFSGSDLERTSLISGLYGIIRRRLEAFVDVPFASLERGAAKAKLDQLADNIISAG
ncbi:MAG: helix-turn-helix domain-containing protein [Hyphomicrobiaceae bacterium]|nr:helix-turn-helix domain-containing protein [Hyphomicrobiaceae bacterium]